MLTRILRPSPSLLLLLCLWAVQASAAEALVFCLEKADVRPWRTQDGRGLNIELLDRVALRLGVKFEYRGLPWKRCLADLKANAVDGAIGASFKQERLAFGVYPGGATADASKRLNNERYIVLRRKDSAVRWDGSAFHGLDGPVGVQLGYSVGDQLRALGATVDEGAEKPFELAQKLAAGRVAAAAMLAGEVTVLMEQHPQLKTQLEALPLPLVEKPYFLMLSNELVNSRRALSERLWRTIEAVRNSRQYQQSERAALRHGGH